MTRWIPMLGALCFAAGAAAQTPAPPAEGPGALLYSTHCAGCHTAQVHWRDARAVTSWAALQDAVRRWEQRIGLGWSDADIAAVARHLNRLYYHFPEAGRIAARPLTAG
jgi:mono/diheme cytochrome c family protein